MTDHPDRVIEDGDLVVLDFGPVFGEWEADYGRTYLVGEDPVKARLIADVEAAFARGKGSGVGRAGHARPVRCRRLCSSGLRVNTDGSSVHRRPDI
jgi:hypothetical protein